MECAKCGAELKPVFDTPMRRHDDWNVQYQNALGLTFAKAYGMYNDDDGLFIPYRQNTLIICGECTDALLASEPWMTKVMTPRKPVA